MTDTTAGRKDTQRLQRAIVDGLEDVKAQDIRVFDTEHLSPLFERVIVASGTSNRQTKALASSVRDAVREAGFPKPRIEGEDNGEWIIVDCGAAVAHIMQPAIRTYYHLEEIWGEKPVRMRFGAPKPMVAMTMEEPERPARAGKGGGAAKTAAKSATRTSAKTGGSARKTPSAKKAPVATKASTRSSSNRAPSSKAAPKPSVTRQVAVQSAAVKKTAKQAAKKAAPKAPARKA